MKKALIVIDYSNDFVATDGALTVGRPGQALEGKILDLANDFLKEKDPVVFAIDVHKENDPYHPETKLFPPHNLLGSKGRDLYGKLADFYAKHYQKNQPKEPAWYDTCVKKRHAHYNAYGDV